MIKENWRRSIVGGIALLATGALSVSAPIAPAQAQQSELRIATNTLATLDPLARNPISSDMNLHTALYAALTAVDPNNDVVPDLAEKWENPTPLDWVFRLRKGATFEDGQPLDANVVVANLNYRIDPKSGNAVATLGKAVESITAPDAQTVSFKLKVPSVEFPRLLTGFVFSDLNHLAGKTPPGKVNASGPYRLVRFNPDGETLLEANPAFYGQKPAFAKARYIVLPQVSTIIAGLLADQLDFAEKISRQESAQLKADPTLTVGALSSFRTLYYRINPTVKPLDDQRVRQAINYAIDKQLLIDTFVDGKIAPVGQVLNQNFSGFNPDVPAYPYNPAKARSLLAEAGYPNGFPVELELATGQNQAGDLIAQVLAKQLGDVGIKVSITPEPFQVWSDRTGDPKKAAGLSENSLGGDGTLQAALVPFTSLNNRNHADDPEYDRLYDEFLKAGSADEANAKARALNARAHDYAPAIFMYAQPRTYVVSDRVKWKPRPDDRVKPQDFQSVE